MNGYDAAILTDFVGPSVLQRKNNSCVKWGWRSDYGAFR